MDNFYKLYYQMLDSNLNEEQKRDIGQEILLTLEMQKHLNIYTNKIEERKHLTATLRTATGQLFTQIGQLMMLVSRIKRSMQISNKISEIEKEEDLDQIPQFVIKDVNALMIKSQKEVMSVANKLKVLVSKTMQTQAHTCKYHFPSYLALAQDLLSSAIFDPRKKNMREQLGKLREEFKAVNFEDIIKYKLHSTNYIRNKDIFIYVSFYIERLLFFQGIPLPFNGNLLFVPLQLQKYESIQTNKTAHILIYHWYFKQLNKHNINWEHFCLQLIIRDTKKEKIKYYSLINFQKKRLGRLLDNQTIDLLRKIRCFVYFHLIFNYMQHTLIFNNSSNNSKKSIKIQLNQKLTLEINNQQSVYAQKTNVMLTKYFLQYFDEKQIKNRAQENKTESTNNFIRYMLCNICALKHNVELPLQYINLKPKYIYIGDKRVKV